MKTSISVWILCLWLISLYYIQFAPMSCLCPQCLLLDPSIASCPPKCVLWAPSILLESRSSSSCSTCFLLASCIFYHPTSQPSVSFINTMCLFESPVSSLTPSIIPYPFIFFMPFINLRPNSSFSLQGFLSIVYLLNFPISSHPRVTEQLMATHSQSLRTREFNPVKQWIVATEGLPVADRIKSWWKQWASKPWSTLWCWGKSKNGTAPLAGTHTATTGVLTGINHVHAMY